LEEEIMDLMSMAQLLGNFGEFFGAIAVFVTLGYLALQIRETRKTLIRANERNLTSDFQAVSMKMAEHSDLRRSFRTGIARWQDLEEEDAMGLHMWLWSYFSCLEHATVDKQTGRFESELLNIYGEGAVNVLRAPGGKTWWDTNRSLFSQELQSYVELMLPKGTRTTFDVFNIPEQKD
jgi:hypothetical protein